MLPLGGQLHEPERGGSRQPCIPTEPQRVVLLLDQPADGVERLLVLQPPVQQFPAELVPAVRAQVALGVQLAELDLPNGPGSQGSSNRTSHMRWPPPLLGRARRLRRTGGERWTPERLGHTGGMDQGTTRGSSGPSRTPGPAI